MGRWSFSLTRMTTNKYRQNDWFMKLSMDAKIKKWKSWWETCCLHSLKNSLRKCHHKLLNTNEENFL